MLVLVTGVFDFGLAFQQYEVVTNAAREGARLGSLGAGYLESDIQARVDAYCVAAGLPGGCPAERVTVDRSATLTVAGQPVSAVASDRELPAQLRARRTRAAADQRIARHRDPARDVDDAVRDRLFLKGNT